jgi:LacI family transcriptional regulator
MSLDPENGPSGSRPVGIKDIARALGVSTGTVDRALHAKPGVNPETRARVLSMAEQLGYRPNLAARYLQSRRQLRISVHLPREIALFWDTLREGIREAAAPFAPAVQVEFRSYPTLGKGDVPLFEEALRDGMDGLIVAPGKPAALEGCFRKAAHQGLPVICVVTDAPDSQRLASVSADPYTVGAVAGELLARFQPAGGKVAFFTGWLSTQDHADKFRGFEASLLSTGGAVRLGPVVEAHDDEREAYRRALAVLRAHPDLTSIYVSTVNSLPVVRAAAQEGRLPGLTLVTTDLFPELVEHLRSGAVAATVYQRPLSQGRLAFRALYHHLLDGTPPADRIHVVPHLVMRSNLDLLLARLRVDLEGLPKAVAAERKPSRRHDVQGRPARPAPSQARRSSGPGRRL